LLGRNLTSQVTYKMMAKVTDSDTDKYGRTVGVVQVDGVNVNEEIIQAGSAWQYRKYCKTSFCNDWLSIEREVKLSRTGLWKYHDPVPPLGMSQRCTE
jgi:micrococcal nuclease